MEAKLAEYRSKKTKKSSNSSSAPCEVPEPPPASSSNQRLSNIKDKKSKKQLTETKEVNPPCDSSEGSDHELNADNCGLLDLNKETATTKPPLELPLWLQGTKLATLIQNSDIILGSQTFLKVVLWLILWGLFIEIGFGAVYFVISTLIIIYFTMRTDKRKPGELSAYSAFNPNFETLDGQFTAEQFERELRYGAGSVR